MATVVVNETVTYSITGLTRTEMRCLDLALAYAKDHPEIYANIQDKVKTATALHNYIVESLA